MVEYIDVYDRNRVRTGLTVPREGARLGEGQYQLYVTAILQALDGRYLVTRRSLDKSWGAGWWEVTGGSSLVGEDSLQAVVREVGEEVGLDVSGIEPELVYSYENVDLARGDNYFMDIYRFAFDLRVEDVVLQESEAIDCKLATWEEIEELNAQGVFLHFKRIATALGKL